MSELLAFIITAIIKVLLNFQLYQFRIGENFQLIFCLQIRVARGVIISKMFDCGRNAQSHLNEEYILIVNKMLAEMHVCMYVCRYIYLTFTKPHSVSTQIPCALPNASFPATLT